jgi:hypothetical protein
MMLSELERRLEIFLTEQPVERFNVSESGATDFLVELTLNPNTPITERFILRLETVLGEKIGSLSLFRVRSNVLIVRFTLPRDPDEDPLETGRIQESPSRYLNTSQWRRSATHPMVASCEIKNRDYEFSTTRPGRSFRWFGPTRFVHEPDEGFER